MSKKLLMSAGDAEFGGPIIYETVSGTDITPAPSDPNRVLVYDKTVYLEEFFGGQSVVNDLLATIGSENPDGTYTYKIKATSVKNPNKSKTVTIKLDINIVGGSRFYWDDTSSRYYIEKSWDFIRISDTSQLSVQNNPINTAQKLFGWIDTRYDIQHNNFAYAGPSNTVSNWTIYGYNNLASYDPYPKAVTGFLGNGTWGPGIYVKGVTTLDVMETYLQSNPPAEMVMKLVSSAVKQFPTDITEKIKLPQFDGGTTYSMIPSIGEFTSSLSVSIPTMETKYLPKTELFTGTTVTPVPQDPNFVINEDKGVYLNAFEGAHVVKSVGDYINDIYTLGERLDENRFKYTVTATSADGTKTKDVTFELDYQMPGIAKGAGGVVANNLPVNKMFWNEELHCYDINLSDEYLCWYGIDNTFDEWTATYYNSTYSKNQTLYYWGKYIPEGQFNSLKEYGVGDRDPQVAASFMPCSPKSSVYYPTTTSTRPNQNEPYIGIQYTGKNTKEAMNEFLATFEYAPIEIIYRRLTTKVVHTNIKKKIKLPYFGEGTVYTMKKVSNSVTISPNIEIGIPLKYDFKIAYRIFDGRDIKLKNMEGRIIRNELPAYLEEVRGNSSIVVSEDYVNNQLVRTETIKLLGTPTPRGWYSYNIYKTNDRGKTEMINFELPEMLCWWPGGNSSRPTAELSFECPSQDDILYWDAPNKCYRIKRRTEYYFANSAYSDIEFLPYEYTTEDIGPGAWEFCTEGVPNNKNQFGSSSYSDINTNYISRAFNNAYSTSSNAHSWGVVFPILYGSNSAGAYPSSNYSYNVFGIYTTAKTLDDLNVFLANRPFHLITAAYYPNKSKNKPYPIRNTNVTKPVEIDLSNDDVNKGVNLKVMNGDIDARFKIAVPVTYTEIDVPTPTYDLGAPKDFNGSNVYVNTNIQLFNQAKDFTILLDYQHKTSDSTYVANDRTILHCRYENTGTSYKQCGLAVETTTAPQARIRCATDYSGEVLASPYTLNMYQSKNPDSVFNTPLYRYRTVIVYKAGLPYKVIQAGDGDIIQEYELYKNVPPFRAHTRPLYLGCQNSTSNSRSRYFAGRINECKVWDGVALTDGQILKILGDGPYPKESFTVSNKKFTGNQTSQVADNQLDTRVTIFDYGFTDVDFTIFLEFDKGTGGSSTPRVLCCSDTTSGYEFLSVHSEDSRKTFNIRAYNSGDSKYYELLKKPLPSVKDHYKFFICYRAGMIDSVIDYSTGVPVRLELADTLPTAPPSLSLKYYNVLLGAAPFSSLTDTRYVWGGTIKHCKIWKGKLLSSYDMDYVINNILK